MTSLVPLPVALPLAGAALSLVFSRQRTVQRWIGVAVTAACVVVSAILVWTAHVDGTLVMQVGDWEAPLGITLIVDRLAGLMLLVSTVIVLAVLLYGIGQLDTDREALYFHPVYLVLAAGVSASFITGDLFNLFVAFEIMLIASYVLITLGGTRRQLRAGMTYVVINVVSSTMFVTTVAFVYAATGTVSMAQLATRVSEIPSGLAATLGLLLLVVFGTKAAIFPLFFWLPDSYPTAPAPVTAVFAGLLTKVGVYAMIRTQTLIFPTADGSPSTLLLFLAGATMFVGVMGAIAQNDVKRILSFHIVSQIGYMILGLGLFTVAGLAGGIFYIVHHIVVKTSLFLVGGIVETATGTGALDRLGGLAKRLPVVAVLFGVAALSLAGIPPLSGFVAKLALVQAGMAEGRYLVIGVSLLVSLLTLFSMSKIWANTFWGPVTGDMPIDEAARDRGDERPPLRARPLTLAATGALVGVSLVIAFGAAPLYSVSEAAADELLQRAPYVEAVLGGESEVARR